MNDQANDYQTKEENSISMNYVEASAWYNGSAGFWYAQTVCDIHRIQTAAHQYDSARVPSSETSE